MKHSKTAASILLCIIVAITSLPTHVMAESKDIVEKNDNKYSYVNLTEDIRALTQNYPDILKYQNLGYTVDKRKIHSIRLGAEDASKSVIITASAHAREYINSHVAMTILEKYAQRHNTGKYKNKKYSQIFEETAIYIVPMVNPDGVTISQFGPSKIKDVKLRKRVVSTSRNGSYKIWKANARGVDINRNFSSGFVKTSGYASEFKGGPKAFSEKETVAVKKLVEGVPNLKGVINLHTRGQIIYWGYTSKNKSKCTKFANMVSETTRYNKSRETGRGNGDMEHWLLNKVKCPYVCVENGRSNSPVSYSEFKDIVSRNATLIEKTAYIL
ncbi:MAG: M14 family zinc carboxypeptidase [Anaerovoracaceae bacterium]